MFLTCFQQKVTNWLSDRMEESQSIQKQSHIVFVEFVDSRKTENSTRCLDQGPELKIPIDAFNYSFSTKVSTLALKDPAFTHPALDAKLFV